MQIACDLWSLAGVHGPWKSCSFIVSVSYSFPFNSWLGSHAVLSRFFGYKVVKLSQLSPISLQLRIGASLARDLGVCEVTQVDPVGWSRSLWWVLLMRSFRLCHWWALKDLNNLNLPHKERIQWFPSMTTRELNFLHILHQTCRGARVTYCS